MMEQHRPRTESTIDDQLATPAVDRFLTRHPELRAGVGAVLDAANDVRRIRPAALPDDPTPTDRGRRLARFEVALEDAVAELEAVAAAADAGPGRVHAAVRRVLGTIAELRVHSQRFDRPRPRGEPAARSALVGALHRFRAALDRLRRDARRAGAGRLPWRLELATDIDPVTHADDIELGGPGLPGTPAADLPRGDRCLLTGTPYLLDSRRAPVTRYRSLDSWATVLSPWAHGIARRISAALERLATSHPDAVRQLVDVAPWLVEERIAVVANPSFVRLGLLDTSSLAVAANNTLLAHADLPLLGHRGAGGRLRSIGARDRTEAMLAGSEPGYGWSTYGDVRDRALGLAHGLERVGVRPGSRLAIVTRTNRPEFFITDLACVFSDLVSVGVLDTLADDAVYDIAAAAEVETVVADRDNAGRFTTDRCHARCPMMTTVVVLDPPTEPARADGVIQVVAFDDVVTSIGDIDPGWRSSSGVAPSTPVIHDDDDGVGAVETAGITEDGDDDVFTLVFTSGTTGHAKGVVITRRQWIEVMRPKGGLWPHVEVSYQPSALGADRTVMWRAFAAGGRIGFGRRSAGLLADIQAIRPTVLEAPPAILNALYGEFRRAVSDPECSRERLAVVKRRMRDQLGGRLAFLATGGAASEPAVREVLGEVLGLPVAEGYGTTETGTIATDGRLKPDIEFRLVDVPDLGFTAADRPHPRGELAVRTARTGAGYFAAGAADRAAFTDDGFFLTCDIVELVGDRRIRIIGRRKQFFKLAGAEFVYPDLLERHFMTSDLVRAVFVTGLPTEPAVVAVVVPTDPTTGADEIHDGLRAVARRVGLRPFEVPVGVVVEPPVSGELPWTPDNGLLTPSFKLNRHGLDAHYADRIRDLYAAAGDRLDRATASDDAGRREIAQIRHLTANLLGLHPSEIDLEGSFSDHGGGSLAAMELVLRLRQLLPPGGARRLADDAAELTEIPLAEIAGWLEAGGEPDSPRSPASVAAIARAAVGSPSAPTETRHQRSARQANRDAAWCELPEPLPPVRPGGDILLTGATGFLGVHLVAELAASLGDGQRLYALIRAADHDAAKARLERTLADAGLDVPMVAAGRAVDGAVVALAGSLDTDGFGLDPEDAQALADGVGLIHHAGAAVSFEPSYGGVRETNVGGTRRVLELATTGRCKAVHFTSSLNVAYLLAMCGVRPVLEDTPLPDVLTPDIVARSLGYAVSKWVGERIIHGAFAAAAGALRLSISRPALITWSTRTGFANESDWFTRVLRSCLEMGRVIGPPEAGVPRCTPLTSTTVGGLDLVPVDYVARAVRRLGELTLRGSLPPTADPGRAPTFHISNLAPDEHGLVTVERLMAMLVAADLRCSDSSEGMRSLPLADWLLEVEARGAAALPILDMLARMDPTRPRTRAERFTAVMEAIAADGAIECPSFDQSLVDRFVRRVRRTAPHRA